MNPQIVANAISRSLRWLSRRGRTVSRHVQAHTRSTINAARNRPWYLERSFGYLADHIAQHSIFRMSNVRRLFHRVLKNPDRAYIQQNGRVAVEKMFDRVIGRGGERGIRLIIDPRTGRIVTAFPIASLGASSGFAIPIALLDDHLEEIGTRLEAAVAQAHPPERDPHWLEHVADFLDPFAPAPAGDRLRDYLVPEVERIIDFHSAIIVREMEAEGETRLSDEAQDAVRRNLRDALYGWLAYGGMEVD